LDCTKVNEVLGRMGDKWTILVVTLLNERPHRFNELKRLIGGVSQQMLTRTLRGLERDGMVAREVFATVPPQVEYSLTDLGRSISAPLMQLAGCLLSHIDEIERHRSLYDERNDDQRTRRTATWR
jgi:DNA-binding HxlR family transcriptional regulator